jgi:DNA-binding IclR family transcriptional regulator
LEAIARRPAGMGFGELAGPGGTGIPAASVVRILRTLRRRGFLVQPPGSSQYRLGLRLHALGVAALAGLEVVQAAATILPRLAAETGETAELVLLDGEELTWAATMDAPGALRLAGQAATGLRAHRLHSNAPGKLFLALAEDADGLLRRYVARHALPAWTPHTIADLGRLRDDLAQIRARGYAIDREENRVGLWRCAAPVYAGAGRLEAALGIAGAMGRHSPAREQGAIGACLTAAAALSRRLGSADHPTARDTGF